MQGYSFTRAALAAAVALCALGFAAPASAQNPPAGLGDQLYSTGGEITIEVRPATAGLVSELRLYNADGTFTPIASNREVGRIVTLPAPARRGARLRHLHRRAAAYVQAGPGRAQSRRAPPCEGPDHR
jgi:hypothetical protein